ncbi:MAG TPA: hypothetical protein VMM36_13495 [Opitutaceae bacterium]|nr:hypothetical protein [Opitutaceae bacterium]
MSPRPLVMLASAILVVAAPSVVARTMSVVVDSTLGDPAHHGLAKFEEAVRARGWKIERVPSAKGASGDAIVCVALPGTLGSWSFAPRLEKTLDEPEALAVKKFSSGGKPAVLFVGADDRGLMYALLEAAGSITAAPDATLPLDAIREIEERPTIRDRALSVYTMNRAHWESRFYDEDYWKRYFDLLAASRFNRYLLIFGYENGGFLAPPYPYFFDTPGFPGVQMVGITPGEQRRNLAALNRLIDLAHERGITVTLGIWDHIYRAGVQTGGTDWVDEFKGRTIPNSVEGVTTENLNEYTKASLRELLARVPEVDSMHFRVHEESGLKPEEMVDFWTDVFNDFHKVKPGIMVELRGKNTPDAVIDTALALGVDLRIETKHWMEQMGLPFHPMHTNPPDQMNRRHGYADFLRYPQRYQMTWRLWTGGTLRVLLWGDPDYVRRYGANTALYDSPNWDVQEPLATKMEAQRPDMPTFDLMPAKYRYYDYEFERYWPFFTLWGRLGYNPATPTDVWQREFRRRFGDAAPHIEAGLQHASQVLPRIVASVYPYSGFPTTRGWPERQSLGASLEHYADNEATDVELFENFAHAAERILSGGATAMVTPDATSRWFDATADAVLASVRAAEAATGDKRDNEFDSTITDLKILAQLARFHARRSLAAVHYNLFLKGQRKAELLAATAGEKEAIAAWRELVRVAGDRYAFDLAMGARNHDLCGHWRDELAELETNLAKLEAQAAATPDDAVVATAWSPATDGDRLPPEVECERVTTAPVGEPIRIVARATDPSGVRSLRLRYRHVTQYEDYLTIDMAPTGRSDEFAATIPGNFVIPKWDVMYFIEAIDDAGNGAMWPDYNREPPYVFVNLQR